MLSPYLRYPLSGKRKRRFEEDDDSSSDDSSTKSYSDLSLGTIYSNPTDSKENDDRSSSDSREESYTDSRSDTTYSNPFNEANADSDSESDESSFSDPSQLENDLIQAVINNDRNEVHMCIRNGADVHFADGSGKTALLYAVVQNNETLVRKLIKAGADIDANFDLGQTALIHLAKYANKRRVFVDRRLRRVVDYNGSEAIVRILINAGAEVNKTDRQGKTALYYSLQNNNFGFAQELIKAGADVNKTYDLGETLLETAVKFDNERLVFFLIDAGADVNIADKSGINPLMHSILNGNDSVARKLIREGADLDKANIYGQTALMYFAEWSRVLVIPRYVKSAHLVRMTKRPASSSKISRNNLIDTLLTAGPDLNASDSQGNTALTHAVHDNNESFVSKLINAGARIDILDHQGKTPLIHSASKGGNSNIAYHLVTAGADVNIADYDGNTALIYSVKNNNESVVSVLIDAGADVNFVDAGGKTALFYSLQNQDIALELIDAGADVNITDNQSISALMCAIHELGFNPSNNYNSSMINVLVSALIDAGADVNITDNQGKTALILAVQNHSNSLACKLIDAGANVDMANIQGKTALIYSIQSNKQRRGVLAEATHIDFSADEDITSTLIKAGSDVNLTDNTSKHALIYAAQNSNRRVSSTLIDAGSDVNLVDKEGKTALFYAIQNGNEGLAKLLIDAGADTDVVDGQGKTVLIDSILYGNKSLSLSVINTGADVNWTDNNGKTALFYAASNENVSMVQCLLKAGADVNITDHDGKTVLFYAAFSESVVRVLTKHSNGKAFINKRDRHGRSPLFYAITKSLASARCLLANGGNLQMRDNCNMTVLSYFIEHHMKNVHVLSPGILNNGIKLFTEKGVQANAIFDAMINAAFLKVFPTTLWIQTGERASPYDHDMMSVFETLQLSRKYITEDSVRKSSIVKRILSLKKEPPHSYMNSIPAIVQLFLELRANPNYADADGNTAVHYVACLPTLLKSTERTLLMKILSEFERFGVSCDARNHQNETPLLFCLSKKVWALLSTNPKSASMKMSIKVCDFLVQHGANVDETSRNGESVFHLIMKLFQQAFLLSNDDIRKDALSNLLELLKLFPRSTVTRAVTVNKRDAHLNSPLHLWAALEYEKTFEGDAAFEQHVIETIFKHLLDCGAKLDDRNAKEETPLHLCKTWTGVELLLDAGANPNVVDSSGSPPMLVAAKNRRRKKASSFYSDAMQDPVTFWQSVLEHYLDVWSVNSRGESVLSILIESGAFDLARALLKVAILRKLTSQDTFVVSLLNTISKDRSIRAHWKSNLVELVLKSTKKQIRMKENEETPLHICCRNIVRMQETSASLSLTKSSVHWTIATQLLSRGFDYKAPDSTGQTCLEIAKACPALKDLLMRPVNEVPSLIPWTSVSKSHEKLLEKVARRQECTKIENYWYHQSHIQKGSFGFVFAGIYEKGGREVAIKRIEKLRMHREEKREIRNLTTLADCEQVVRYLSFIEEEHFVYIVLELMEGNLNNYLSGTIDVAKSTSLCNDIVRGLEYLHQKNILHRDLKPSNILYKVYPKLCLKIADFGLSRSLDAVGTSTTISGSAVGTRCWIAPEILKSSVKGHSKSSDIFSCGLLLHYILSVKKHPFCPCDCTNKSELQITNETENNMMNNNLDGWDSSLCTEATDLIEGMLDSGDKKRPTAADALTHPFFWSKKKKMDLLIAVGNQPEFACPRKKRASPLTAVEIDLENNFGTIIKKTTWNDAGYANMNAIYAQMTMKRRSPYNTKSVVELVRFIRNTHAHVSEDKRPTSIRKLVLEDFVFLDHFPGLTLNVYTCARTHGWDLREEIKYALD